MNHSPICVGTVISIWFSYFVRSAVSVKMAGGPYNYNYIFKYIIIGDMGVGKSCLLHQFTEKKCKWDTMKYAQCLLD